MQERVKILTLGRNDQQICKTRLSAALDAVIDKKLFISAVGQRYAITTCSNRYCTEGKVKVC